MKIKKLTKEQIIIAVDRLTRFKEPEIKYLRVFKEIILSNLIEPKYKKSDLDKMSYSVVRDLAVEIINNSLECVNDNSIINERLFEYENSIFNISDTAKELLKNKINYSAIINLLPNEKSINLEFLVSLSHADYIKQRKVNGHCFPIEKLILCEGITEEILLPKFAKICGFDLGKEGIYVLSAGGKNQVVKYFYNFAKSLKIPIFVLLDSDANENLREIQPKLRKQDKIHLLKAGEFEDLLPDSLIIKALNEATENISLAPIEDLCKYDSKVEFLEEFFKHRGLHEFKKAEFANIVKNNLSDVSDVSDEIKEIFQELITK